MSVKLAALAARLAVCLAASSPVARAPAALAVDPPPAAVNGAPALVQASSPYEASAREVTAHLQTTYYDPARGYYVKGPDNRKADDVWRQAAAVSALVGAARHDPATYRPVLDNVFRSLDAFWDAKSRTPAYEPQPTRGDGNDKYYDDNAWLVITFAEAYQLTGERAFLARATETAKFVAGGWDDQGGGGVWWHQLHKDGSKNACANGPAAVGYLSLARLGPPAESAGWVSAARKAADWTCAKLQAPDGLFDDRIIVATGEVKRGKLTYNQALMVRACLGLYRAGGKPEDLENAKRIAKAADDLLDRKTGVWRDPLKWSQFMVEADLDLYRATGEAYLWKRAETNADAYYAAWKRRPSDEQMATAGTARVLWLMADAETEVGRAFWKKADEQTAAAGKRGAAKTE